MYLRGRVIVAEWAREHDGLVSFRGRRRERDLLSGDRYYPIRSETVRLRAGERVEWLAPVPIAVAA